MIITIQNTKISASINSFGAELLTLKKGKTNYIWTVDTSYWNKTSPILFPIVGRLKKDVYTYNDTSYSLPRHGFARDNAFEIIRKTDTEVVFSFSSNEITNKVYPFDFELQIGYTLLDNKLSISYKVINKSKCEMPFSIGAHPAFAISNDLKEYALVFNSSEPFESHLLENDLFSGLTQKIPSNENKIPLSYELFANDALVFKNLNSTEVALVYQDKPLLKMDFKGFPYLGIWTKDHAPFICIEPWFGHADNKNSNGELTEKEGIQIVAYKETFRSQFSIEIF